MEFEKDNKIDAAFESRKSTLEITGEVLSQEDLLEEVKPLSSERLDEIAVWAEVLKALKDGLPLPNNPLINLRRIEREEEKSGNDYSDLKKCCAGANEVRDSKDFKPYITSILKRISDISGVKPIVRV